MVHVTSTNLLRIIRLDPSTLLTDKLLYFSTYKNANIWLRIKAQHLILNNRHDMFELPEIEILFSSWLEFQLELVSKLECKWSSFMPFRIVSVEGCLQAIDGCNIREWNCNKRRHGNKQRWSRSLKALCVFLFTNFAFIFVTTIRGHNFAEREAFGTQCLWDQCFWT